MTKKSAKSLTVFVSFLMVSMGAYAQKDMLITQMANSKIIRKSYSANGSLESKQHFRVSRLDTVKGKLKTKVKVKLYNKKGNLQDQYITNYTCNPDKSDMLLAIYPFAKQGNATYKIEASSEDFSKLYDFSRYTGKLQPIEITMHFKSGVLGFFGSKNHVRIKDRRLKVANEKFLLNSALMIKTYMWGIRVNTIHYDLKEQFNSDKTLVKQKFKYEDGSHFLIKYNHKN
jgi:hypothetical protein